MFYEVFSGTLGFALAIGLVAFAVLAIIVKFFKKPKEGEERKGFKFDQKEKKKLCSLSFRVMWSCVILIFTSPLVGLCLCEIPDCSRTHYVAGIFGPALFVGIISGITIIFTCDF